MYPILLDFGPLVLPAWHTFYVIGAIAALLMLLRLGRRFAPEVPSHEIARVFATGYVFGYLGARLLSIVIEEPDVRTFGEILMAMVRFGPMTFYGGAIAAFIFGSAYVLWRRMPFATLCDIAIPSCLVALAFGRIGCFLNGDDYGKAAPLSEFGSPWWAVTFPNLQDGIARYPVQLMEAGSVVMLAGLLLLSFERLRRTLRPGVIGFIGIVGYANLRFILEFFRDDFRGSPFSNWMSTSQFISILVLVVAAITIPFWIRAQSPKA